MHLEGSIEAEHLLAIAVRNGMRPRWETARGAACRLPLPRSAGVPRSLLRGLPGPGARARFLRHHPRLSAARTCRCGGACRDLRRAARLHRTRRADRRGDGRRAGGDARRRASMASAPACWSARSAIAARPRRCNCSTQVMPWADEIAGFGLGGAEIGNPPGQFATCFRACRERGFRITAHAGEEGPASYVREALDTARRGPHRSRQSPVWTIRRWCTNWRRGRRR